MGNRQRQLLKCKAKSSRTGEPCKRWASIGYRVCSSHGVGTNKRVLTGERKDPTTSNISHGLYATKAVGFLALAAAQYKDLSTAQLFDVTQMQRGLFGLLGMLDDKAKGQDGYAIDDARKILAQMVKTSETYNRLAAVGKDAMPMSQVQGLMEAIFTFLTDIVTDLTVPRHNIPATLQIKMMQMARHLEVA